MKQPPHRDRRASTAKLLAGAAVFVAAAGLAGCTTTPSTDTQYDSWYQRMQTIFHDSNGVGGGGGAKPGTIQVGTIRPGNWTVYTTCNNAPLLHLQIREAGKLAAETDIPCGATIALPVTVTAAGSTDFEIKVSHPKGAPNSGWWTAWIDSTSWRQTASFTFH